MQLKQVQAWHSKSFHSAPPRPLSEWLEGRTILKNIFHKHISTKTILKVTYKFRPECTFKLRSYTASQCSWRSFLCIHFNFHFKCFFFNCYYYLVNLGVYLKAVWIKPLPGYKVSPLPQLYTLQVVEQNVIRIYENDEHGYETDPGLVSSITWVHCLSNFNRSITKQGLQKLSWWKKNPWGDTHLKDVEPLMGFLSSYWLLAIQYFSPPCIEQRCKEAFERTITNWMTPVGGCSDWRMGLWGLWDLIQPGCCSPLSAFLACWAPYHCFPERPPSDAACSQAEQ